MKTSLLTFQVSVAMAVSALADTSNPITEFKARLIIPPGDKILKWECDVNGDGKKEVLLSLKSEFDKDMENHEPPSWDFFIAGATGDFKIVTTVSRHNRRASIIFCRRSTRKPASSA